MSDRDKNEDTIDSASPPAPPILDPSSPLARYWLRPLYMASTVNPARALPELTEEPVRERHRIYCYLLMALIRRFWNGNKNGPTGCYPYRFGQIEPGQDPLNPQARYRGDMEVSRDPLRVSWDRYLGHNIAGLAVDGCGEVIDFDFNHNNLFRSSAEHAEARIVRRLFSLTNVFDNWHTGEPLPRKSRAFSLKDVTIYTSLESCAQCSGIMSLGRVKQVVYLQTDPGTYTIGNLMYNLAGQDPSDGSFLAAVPIAASAVGLEEFNRLDRAYAEFYAGILDAQKRGDRKRAFYVPYQTGAVDYDPSITSFLCTDAAYTIFRGGADGFDHLQLRFPEAVGSIRPDSWTNAKCLEQAHRFFQYADIEGYRGSPHQV